jgi:NADH dehydrogenase FAD-containing subunit
VRASGLANDSGFVPADVFTLRAAGHEHVFVVGDAAALTLPVGKPHPKAGLLAVEQARAVAASLQAIAAARAAGASAAPALARQSGRAFCTLEAPRGGAMRVTVDLLGEQPRFEMTSGGAGTDISDKRTEVLEWLARWFAA